MKNSQRPDLSFSKHSASDFKNWHFCCLQWEEDNLVLLGHDLQDLSSDTDREIFSLTPILLPTSFPFFFFLTFTNIFCPDIYIQPDGASLALDLSFHIREKSFFNASSWWPPLNLCLHSALSLENIKLNITKIFLELWNPFLSLCQ